MPRYMRNKSFAIIRTWTLLSVARNRDCFSLYRKVCLAFVMRRPESRILS